MKFFNKLFHLEEKQTSIKTEIIGGLMTFVAMCYILPINASILSSMGMNQQGVFVMTALLSFFVTMIMGVVANYPIVLSAGMGLNAYLAYTLSSTFPSWHQRMILLTICGLLFFIFSLTPVRKKIIESIPKTLKCVISAALGAFILFVGLKNSGIIVADGGTLVKLGNFADPAMLIAIIAIFVTIGLMFSKNSILKTMAIPFGILFAAIAGLTASLIMSTTGAMTVENGVGIYQFGTLVGVQTTLPIAPWLTGAKFADILPAKEVVFYGLLNDGYNGEQFGQDILAVFSSPVSYVAIFSMMFVNLFDTTATLIAVGEKTGIIDENGKMQNYRKAVLADATGALICGPLGTSTVTSFAESNVGVSMGAKTGLCACTAALMFLLSAFIYPVFSIFTAFSVTAPALVCVGLMILTSSFEGLDFKNPEVVFVTAMGVLFAVLCYSISNGIGFGLITYVIIKVVQGKHKEVGLPIYIIAGLFIVAFAAETIVKVLTAA